MYGLCLSFVLNQTQLPVSIIWVLPSAMTVIRHDVLGDIVFHSLVTTPENTLFQGAVLRTLTWSFFPALKFLASRSGSRASLNNRIQQRGK